MGYRTKEPMRRTGASGYRAIEVLLVEKDGQPAIDAVPQVMVVENDVETLHYVQDNMGEFVGNMVKVRRMKDDYREIVEENAKLFERNLEPLFTLFSATAKEHILDKFSGSLRKALLLMAMERYSCDSERMCRALGLTRLKLEKELRRCGLVEG